MSSVLTKTTIVPGNGKSLKSRIIAIENVPIYTVITTKGNIANSSDTTHKNIIAGITKEAINNTFSGSVVTEGEIENENWTWTRGNILFLNGTSISVTPPSTGFCVKIGEALSSTKIFVRITESILL